MESVRRLAGALPFDIIKAINATPLLGGANRATQRFNRDVARLPAPASSDAHILEAVGKWYTWFPGESADDRRQAMQEGATVPRAFPFMPAELLRYMDSWRRTSLARSGPAW